MPRTKKSQLDSLERKVIETPSLSRMDMGIFNEGFDSLPHLASPSFFYIDDNSSWMDNRRTENKRFTESWIELDRAYSCGSSTSYNKKCFSSSSTSSSSGCCCHSFCCCSCSKFIRILVYLLIAISVIGFAAIVSGILYMEIFHKFDEPYLKWTHETTIPETRANSSQFPPILQTTASGETINSTIGPFRGGLNVSTSELHKNRSVEVPTTSSTPSLIKATISSLSNVTTTRQNPSSEVTLPTTVVVPTTLTEGTKSNDTSDAIEEKITTATLPRSSLRNSATTVTEAEMGTTSITNISLTSSTVTSEITKLIRDWSRRNPPLTTTPLATATTGPTTIPPIVGQ